MRSFTQLNDRDLTVLQALSRQVRLFGQRQLAEALWNGDVANARRRLRRYAELGLVRRRITTARPLPELLCPVFQWQPGQLPPDVGQVAFHLQSRWRYQAMRGTVVYQPTRTVIDHFGGRQKATLSSQVSHDLGVAEIWLWFYCNRPALAAAWRGEDLLTDSEPGESVPDAVIVDEREQPVLMIEFGGDYSSDRIASFHDDAEYRNMAYQIW